MFILLVAALAQHPDTVRLPAVVTTASRLAPRPGSVTTSTTVLTGSELRERGVVFLRDALRDVPGVSLVQTGSDGAATSLFLRGGESDYVKVLVDGVPMNAPGGAFNFANLTTADVDRIEIVRGPASVVFGADAMAGVIQVFTRRGTRPLAPTLSLEAGGRGGRRVGGSISGAGPAGSIAVEAGALGTDGSYPFNSAYRHSAFAARVALPVESPVAGGATIRYGDSRAQFPTNASGVPADSNQFTTERQVALGVDLARAVGRWSAVQARGRWSRTEDGFRNRLDHPGDTVGFGFVAARDTRVDRSGGDVHLSTAILASVPVVIGAAYEDERQRQAGSTTSNFGFGPATERDAFRARRSTRTLYTELAVDAASWLTVTGGGRLDDNSAFGTFITWRMGGSLTPRDGTTLRGQLGRAFKAPTFPELFARSPYEVGDPTLMPEHAMSWSAGLEQSLGRRHVVLSLEWFEQRFRDLIQYSYIAPGTPTYGNVAAASARGLEVGLQLSPAPSVSLSAQATALRTRVTDDGGHPSPAFREGAPLVRRPAVSGSVAARWQPTASAMLRLDLHHQGSRADIDYRNFPAERVDLAARQTADLAATLRWPVAGAPVMVNARIENLLDARWQQAVGFPGRGRLVTIGLRIGC